MTLRVLVPALALIAAIGLAFAVYRNSSRQQHGQAPAATGATAQGPAAPTPAGPTAPTATEPSAGAQAQPTTETAVAPIEGLRARTFAGAGPYRPIGEPLEPAGPTRATQTPYELSLEFSEIGAGIESLRLASHFETIRREEHIRLQESKSGVVARRPAVVVPMAALGIEINGVTVGLTGRPGEPVWRQTEVEAGHATFEAIVEDGSGREVARLVRTYALRQGEYAFELRQRVENLTDAPLVTRWMQYGPVDLPADAQGYGGEKRRVRFGYLLPQSVDPTRTVLGRSYETHGRADVLGSRVPMTGADGRPLVDQAGYPVEVWEDRVAWPDALASRERLELVWAALTNRYFGVAVHPLVDPSSPGADKALRTVRTIDRFVVDPAGGGAATVAEPTMILRMIGEERRVPAGGAADLSVGVYAGPLSQRAILRDPAAAVVGLHNLVVYNFGGPCGFCTFSWLTWGLLGLLHALHDYLVFDWAVSIVLLVLIVRSILHPVTRWSQIRMQRFGKQMQDMAPKQKKIQERYKDDPQKLREETAKLWREEGISPTGALGCLPMFLQTPVWIALYAMLYFAVELRHEAAFYGVFQAVQPQNSPFWWFLGDLAEPDRFWYFGRTLFNAPLLGPISSLNLLPLILGVVFFLQQKYLTPPTSATLTPEQEQQQKIMKVMMVVMFPLFMYNAPSGLALYFIANSTLGILESRWIRAHITKHDLLTPPKRGPRAPGGFFQRLQALAEAQQKQGGRGLPGRGPGRR